MPAPTTLADFLQLVRKSGLVQEQPLAALLEHLGDLGQAGDEHAQVAKVASAMVCRGLLSIFQAEKLLEGKCRGFTIGNYRVLERLGKGGLGNVYLCQHQFTGRRMAVKVLRGANSEDPVAIKRFYREAKAAASLQHPNIVRAYDVGQDDKLHFLVMDYVDGATLEEIVQAHGPMDLHRAAHYARQAAEGLQYAHQAGFVHRDIKPANLMLNRQGAIKLLDMGLARVSQSEVDVLTKGTDVLGSAEYLAPEQAIDSHGVDIRADIYGLGSTLFFLLTGLPPYSEAKTIAQKLMAKQTRPPQAVRALRPEAPQPLADVLQKMMALNPDARYATPAEIVEALTPFTKTPIPPPPEAEMPQTGPAVAGSSERPATTSSKEPAVESVRDGNEAPVGGDSEEPPPSPPKRPAIKPPPSPAKFAASPKLQPSAPPPVPVLTAKSASPQPKARKVAAAPVSSGWGSLADDEGLLPAPAKPQRAAKRLEGCAEDAVAPARSGLRLTLILVILLVLIAAGAGLYWWLAHRSHRSSAQPAPASMFARINPTAEIRVTKSV
jgi:serine/threonine protein kinase